MKQNTQLLGYTPCVVCIPPNFPFNYTKWQTTCICVGHLIPALLYIILSVQLIEQTGAADSVIYAWKNMHVSHCFGLIGSSSVQRTSCSVRSTCACVCACTVFEARNKKIYSTYQIYQFYNIYIIYRIYSIY